MDGRDTPPNSGKEYVRQVLAEFDKIGLGKISTIGGRYYGMDRDKRWERIDKAYRAIVLGEGEKHTDPIKAIENSYIKTEITVPPGRSILSFLSSSSS